MIIASFAGALPSAGPVTSAGRTATLTFSPASLGGQTRWQGAGNVGNIVGTESNGVVTLRIALSSPAPVALNANGGKYYLVVGAGTVQRSDVTHHASAAATAAEHLTATVAPASSPGKPEIIFLKYADISEVAALLSSSQVAPNDAFPAQQINFSNGLNGVSGTGSAPLQLATAGQSPGVALAQRLTDTLFVDRRLNAIVAAGTSEENARVKALIATVDVPLPVILVQSEVVELTESAAKDVGIAYGANGYLASATLHAQTLPVRSIGDNAPSRDLCRGPTGTRAYRVSP